MSSRLALITFLDVSGGYPDQGLPQPPLFPSQGPGFPTHPIAPGGGGQPPYPSTGPGFPTHPIAPGGQPPYPSTGPGFPTHPIAPGGQPPGVWPSPPGRPSHPIALPPVGPDNTLPPNSEPPSVSLPIVLPDPPERDALFELKYSPIYGWVLVPAEDTPRPDNTLPPTPQPKR
jgi:hypothetical protein